MTYTRVGSASSQFTFASTSTTQQSVDCAGKTMGNLVFDGVNGSWILTGDVAGTGSNDVLTNGSLDFNGVTFSASTFQSTNSNTRSLTLGAAQITLAGASNGAWSLANASGLTFSGASSTITLTGGGDNEIFRGGGKSYGTVAMTGAGTKTITGANSFVNFTRSNAAACGIKFPSSTTQTFTGTVTMVGTSGNVITITSSSAGTAATLSKASGVVLCDYLSLKDSTAAGGAIWSAGANSSVVSGVTGWTLIYYPDTVSGTVPLTGSVTESYDSGTVYTDTASGTIALTGTTTVSHAYADAPSGTLSLTGTAAEAHSASQTASGTLPLTGTATEERSASDAASGTIALTGSVVESHSRTYTDAVTGTLPLSGSVVESYGHTYTDTCSGTLPVSGTSSDSLAHTDTPSGTIPLTGALVVSHGYADSPSGLIVLTGTATDARLATETVIGVLTLAGALTDRFHVGPPVKDVSVALTTAGAVLGLSSANGVALALRSEDATAREALLPGEGTLPGDGTYPGGELGSTLEIRPESDATLETETTELEMALD